MAALTLAMIASVLAIGVFSSAVFVWQWLTGTPGFASALFLLVTAAGLAAVVFVRVRQVIPRSSAWSPYWLVLAGAAGFAGLWVRRQMEAAPHGGWDAWAVWNLHARFLFRGEHSWTDLFDPVLHWSQNHYPLLLPGFVSGAWNIAGADTPWIPAIVAALFSALTVGITGAAVCAVTGSARGLLAALVLLTTPSLILYTSAQMADIPLSLYILTTVVLLRFALAWPESKQSMLVLAGLSAGFAAWTKMEGLVFASVVLASPWILTVRSTRYERLKDTFRIGIGLAPVILLVFAFRAFLAPTGGMQPDAGTFERLTILSRYVQVAAAFVQGALTFGDAGGGLQPVFLLGLLLLPCGTSATKTCWWSLSLLFIPAFVFAVYFMVYITTPYDLGWHLAYSLDRLLLQLWPATVFVVAASSVALSGHEEARP